MSSQAIIRVENIGKRFIIGHQKQERYTALRDVIANNVKAVMHRTCGLIARSGAREDYTQEEFWALKNIDFTIDRGDRVGIIGRNGAGKSTLLKILSRITEPTEGKIVIRGRVASLLEVGTGFHPELTGRENIFLNGAILGMSRVEIRKKFDEIVDFAEVEKFLDTPVKRYSSGMYVRLAFSVAAHLEPEILVVDEVLAVGDAQFQNKCLGKMEDVSKNEGRTVLFVSHNIPSLLQLCDKGILLKSGNVDFIGNINEAVESYISVNNKSIVFAPATVKANGFKRISVLNSKDQLSDVHRFDENIRVSYILNISDFQRHMTLGIMILDAKQNPVFTDEHYIERDRIVDGEYKIEAIIPSKFLMPGHYTINTGLHIPQVTIMDQCYNHLSCKIEDTGSELSKYGQVPLGLVYVKLKWVV